MKITFVPFSMQFLYMLIPCRRTGGGGQCPILQKYLLIKWQFYIDFVQVYLGIFKLGSDWDGVIACDYRKTQMFCLVWNERQTSISFNCLTLNEGLLMLLHWCEKIDTFDLMKLIVGLGLKLRCSSWHHQWPRLRPNAVLYWVWAVTISLGPRAIATSN